MKNRYAGYLAKMIEKGKYSLDEAKKIPFEKAVDEMAGKSTKSPDHDDRHEASGEDDGGSETDCEEKISRPKKRMIKQEEEDSDSDDQPRRSKRVCPKSTPNIVTVASSLNHQPAATQHPEPSRYQQTALPVAQNVLPSIDSLLNETDIVNGQRGPTTAPVSWVNSPVAPTIPSPTPTAFPSKLKLTPREMQQQLQQQQQLFAAAAQQQQQQLQHQMLLQQYQMQQQQQLPQLQYRPQMHQTPYDLQSSMVQPWALRQRLWGAGTATSNVPMLQSPYPLFSNMPGLGSTSMPFNFK